MYVAGWDNASIESARERDVVGNRVPDSMVEAEKALEELSKARSRKQLRGTGLQQCDSMRETLLQGLNHVKFARRVRIGPSHHVGEVSEGLVGG